VSAVDVRNINDFGGHTPFPGSIGKPVCYIPGITGPGEKINEKGLIHYHRVLAGTSASRVDILQPFLLTNEQKYQNIPGGRTSFLCREAGFIIILKIKSRPDEKEDLFVNDSFRHACILSFKRAKGERQALLFSERQNRMVGYGL
jgi:hypothetical protein